MRRTITALPFLIAVLLALASPVKAQNTLNCLALSTSRAFPAPSKVRFAWGMTCDVADTAALNALNRALTAKGDTLTAAKAVIVKLQDSLTRLLATAPPVPPPVSAPIVTALLIGPKVVTLGAGGTQFFLLTPTWSDGATRAITPSCTATGGSLSGCFYTAGTVAGTFRVIGTANGKADTATVTITGTVTPPPPPTPLPLPAPGPTGMYFNSGEAGCGTDPNVILCDDFEDGDWYSKDCDQANASGGLLQTDGWCGVIYANPITPPGAAICGGAGVAGTNCAAHGGRHTGGQGGVNMAKHEFWGGPVTELWARWYYKTDPGYLWGAEKNMNVTKEAGDITWFNIQLNCGGGPAPTAGMKIQIIHGTDICAPMNVSDLQLQSGRWYYFEVHAKLNSAGTVPDGLIELWVNDCGATGVCTGTPTLRTRMVNVAFDRNQVGCLTNPCKIEVLHLENWANPPSTGTGYWDQVKVSRVGPIGFMP